MSRRMAVAIILLAAAAPQTASAHQMSVFAYVEGRSIQGEVFVGDGTAIANATVTAFGPQGEKLGETTTDGDGHFLLEIRFRCDHRIAVNDGEGHAAEYLVAADELPDDLASSTDDSSVRAELEALRKQVVELRKELFAFQVKIRYSDLLGGVGFLLGLAGVAFYCLAVRRGSPRRSKD